MKNSILIITGGTGGHVIPAQNFFNYIKNESNNVFLLTDSRGRKYIKDIDINKILQIKSSHLTGNYHFKFIAIIKLLIGFIQSVVIFIKVRPKIIISFGSYASLTPLLCFIIFKFFFKTKLYIHEQNSLIGQTNRVFSKLSNKIFVNFNKEYSSINKYKKKIFIVGFPQKKIENNLINDKNKNNINFNFLVFAGSQGSFDILIILTKIIEELKKISNFKKINFIVQCPLQKQKEIKNLLIQNKYKFEVDSFFDNFDNILNKTDIALCRSGAGTINDLINFKIPAIIYPLPSAKDNHQFENARILSDIDCAIIIDKNKIDFDKIILFIRKVINDKNFNKSLINKYSKIKRQNTNELMWAIIQNDQKK